jgi:monothiol glutaredoxin
MALDDTGRQRMDELVNANRVVLFMKGTRRAPVCGFSAAVVDILDGLISTYETVDVLSSPEIREGIKEYSSWPTIPQLYVDGRFVGGADIVREMHATGELGKVLGADAAPLAPPGITVSKEAADALRAAKDTDGEELRFEIDARFAYSLFFGPRQPDDVVVEADGVTFLLDRATARRADGTRINYVEGPEGAGFAIENPNEPPRVKQISPAELKAMMIRGERFELFDVRTPHEREIARIEGARPLDAEGQKHVEGLDRETPLVFHCHHGGRSQAAAEYCLGLGFKKVHNVRGGIDAWSTTVDPSVPRY